MTVVWTLSVALSVILWGVILLMGGFPFDGSFFDPLHPIVGLAAISTLVALGSGLFLFRRCGRWP
jgi:hypothetical protein